MSLLFHKDFSDGLTGANGFDGTSASNGTIVQSAGAGLNGTTGGVTVTQTGSPPSIYGYVQPSMSGVTIYRTAFFTDISGVSLSPDSTSARLYDYAGTSPALCALIMLRQLSGALNIQHYIIDDSAVQHINPIILNGSPEWIELRMQKSSGGGVNDAETQLYFGGGNYAQTGELVSEHTGIVCFTNFTQATHRLGMRSGGVGATGSVIVDEWTMRDDDTPILFGVSAEVEAEEAFKGGGGGSKASLSQYVQIG